MEKETDLETIELETTTESIIDEKQEPLIEVLENLEAQIEKQNSLKTTFIKGAIYGLGTVMGATILVGLLAGATSFFTDKEIFPKTYDIGR